MDIYIPRGTHTPETFCLVIALLDITKNVHVNISARITVQPLNKGHFGPNDFAICREVVSILEGK